MTKPAPQFLKNCATSTKLISIVNTIRVLLKDILLRLGDDIDCRGLNKDQQIGTTGPGKVGYLLQGRRVQQQGSWRDSLLHAYEAPSVLQARCYETSIPSSDCK